MDFTFWTGIVGATVLVIGAAWPEKVGVKPIRSMKNWAFLIGGFLMFLYALLGHLAGGTIFFVMMEIFVLISSLLMMLNTDDRIDALVISISGLAFAVWSVYLFQGYVTIIFILGLTGLGFGFAFDTGSVRRNVALTLGSALMAGFSYISVNWIFFWLNLFFAVLSAVYLYQSLIKQKADRHSPDKLSDGQI